VDDCLIGCKSAAVVTIFKKELLTRLSVQMRVRLLNIWDVNFHDRKAKTAQLVQAGYAERVLKTFGILDCKPVATPLDPNNRLSTRDCPDAIDPIVHRRYRSITGCSSYLVNMTSPDLFFAESQLSKFVQYPGITLVVLFLGSLHVKMV
jgi:hypothetical protein